MKLLSDREKKLLDMIAASSTVKDAAHFIRYHEDPAIRDESMTDDAAYGILYRVRRKYVAARVFINTILAFRNKSPLLRRVLTPSVKEEET